MTCGVVKNIRRVASKISGVPVEQMYAAAELYAKTKKAGIFYTLGITEAYYRHQQCNELG